MSADKKNKAEMQILTSITDLGGFTSSSQYPGLQSGMAAYYSFWTKYYVYLLKNPPPHPDPKTYRRGRIWC